VRLLVSIEERNITLKPSNYSFPRGQAMRFEWLALLAYARKIQPADEGWVSIKEIQQLPLWRGKPIQHTGTNVGRYIQALERSHVKLVEARTLWRGPYRLGLPPEEVCFDVTLEKVAKRLGKWQSVSPSRKTLLLFTEKYSRATSLLLEGRLSAHPRTKRQQRENAWDTFCALAEQSGLDARLRLMANLAAVRVLDSLGKFQAAASTLDECERLVRSVRDPAVAAKFFFANAWRYYRDGDHAVVEQHLARAKALSARSPDAALMGTSADRDGLYLSAKGKYEEALTCLLRGLDVRLLAENFDAIQASCFNIGNTLQRMGERHYGEAGQWLTLCVNICNWLHLGRYEALSEIILAKISLESGKTRSFLKWMKAAERLTEQSRNTTDMTWCHIIRAFYFQKQKKLEEAAKELVKARGIYRGKQDFDQASLDKYLARKFQEVWDEVLEE
jgi:tetratricopeptide (TPR) repeat protein